MLSASTLAAWIRAEYQDMPGLKLTREQACRLWAARTDICDEALQTLIDEGFLHRTGTGKFVCLPRPQGDAVHVTDSAARQTHLRCPHCLRLMVLSEGDTRHASATSFRCEGCRRIVTFTTISA
jgi:hypothetical protein